MRCRYEDPFLTKIRAPKAATNLLSNSPKFGVTFRMQFGVILVRPVAGVLGQCKCASERIQVYYFV